MALNRLASLKGRLQRDQDLRRFYAETVQNYIENGYARQVPVESIPGMLSGTCHTTQSSIHAKVKCTLYLIVLLKPKACC